MAGEASVTKMCQVCGTDVSASPRVKDPTGKYFCKPCAEKAQAAPAAPAARPPAAASARPQPARAGAEQDDVMSKLVTDALSNTGEQCPSCSRPLAKSAIICAYCGFNRDSGKQAKTKVLKPEAPSKEAGATRSGGGGMAVGELFDNAYVTFAFTMIPAIAILVLGLDGDEGTISALHIGFAVMAIGVFIWAVIDAFNEGETGHAIGCIVSGLFFSGIWVYVWGGFLSENRGLRGAIIGLFISNILTLLLILGAIGPERAPDGTDAALVAPPPPPPPSPQGPPGG